MTEGCQPSDMYLNKPSQSFVEMTEAGIEGKREALKRVTKQLYLTLCSMPKKCSSAGELANLFFHDTGLNSILVAERFGFPTFEAFLKSEEMKNFIQIDYDRMMNGEISTIYTPRMQDERVQHIREAQQLGNLDVARKKEREHREKYARAMQPENRGMFLEGKRRLVEILHELGGEERAINLQVIRDGYDKKYGKPLTKEEVRSFFQRGNIRAALTDYCHEEFVVSEEQVSGVLCVQLKKPYNVIRARHDEIELQQQNPPHSDRRAIPPQRRLIREGFGERKINVTVLNPVLRPYLNPVPNDVFAETLNAETIFGQNAQKKESHGSQEGGAATAAPNKFGVQRSEEASQDPSVPSTSRQGNREEQQPVSRPRGSRFLEGLVDRTTTASPRPRNPAANTVGGSATSIAPQRYMERIVPATAAPQSSMSVNHLRSSGSSSSTLVNGNALNQNGGFSAAGFSASGQQNGFGTSRFSERHSQQQQRENVNGQAPPQVRLPVYFNDDESEEEGEVEANRQPAHRPQYYSNRNNGDAASLWGISDADDEEEENRPALNQDTRVEVPEAEPDLPTPDILTKMDYYTDCFPQGLSSFSTAQVVNSDKHVQSSKALRRRTASSSSCSSLSDQGDVCFKKKTGPNGELLVDFWANNTKEPSQSVSKQEEHCPGAAQSNGIFGSSLTNGVSKHAGVAGQERDEEEGRASGREKSMLINVVQEVEEAVVQEAELRPRLMSIDSPSICSASTMNVGPRMIRSQQGVTEQRIKALAELIQSIVRYKGPGVTNLLFVHQALKKIDSDFEVVLEEEEESNLVENFNVNLVSFIEKRCLGIGIIIYGQEVLVGPKEAFPQL